MQPRLVVAILAVGLIVAGCVSERSQQMTCPDTYDGTTRGPGGRIAWSTEGFGGPCIGIYTMSPDGTDVRLVTKIRSDPFYLPLAPAWSPDGRMIGFVGECRGEPVFDLCVMNADGTGLRTVAAGPMALTPPAWSPDGTRLAFAPRADSDSIHVVASGRGAGPGRLTDDPSDNGLPTWSPDGAHIAFSSVRDGDYELYVMDADGTNQTRLTALHGSDANPSWTS